MHLCGINESWTAPPALYNTFMAVIEERKENLEDNCDLMFTYIISLRIHATLPPTRMTFMNGNATSIIVSWNTYLNTVTVVSVRNSKVRHATNCDTYGIICLKQSEFTCFQIWETFVKFQNQEHVKAIKSKQNKIIIKFKNIFLNIPFAEHFP